MESGYQSSTLLLVGTLAAVSMWREQQIQLFWAAITGSGGASQLASAGKPLGISILGVIIITYIAGLSQDAGKMMVALSVGLWLIFLMNKGRIPLVVGSAK